MVLPVALLQLNSGIDPLANAARVAAMAREAADAGAKLILTPEMTGLLDGNRQRMMGKATDEDGDATLAALRDVARKSGATILLGSVPIQLGERCANRCFLIDGSGNISARYDKIHRFDVDLPGGERYRESSSYEAGARAVVADAAGTKLGLTICYDLRFPHLFRALAKAGAKLIAVPAAFTQVTGEAHWHILLRARAIETGCYILAPAQTGHHEDGRNTYGHSLIVSPWGELLADGGTQVGIIHGVLDLAAVDDARARIPALTHDRDFEVIA
jgi:deaminated glutathione amidase